MDTLKEQLRHNKSFWKNPFVVVLSAVVLFFTAQVIGVFMVTPLIPYIPNQNIRLMVFIAANTFALLGLTALAMRLIGFTWQAVGVRWPRLKYVAWVAPAAFLYLLVSLSLNMLAQQFIPGFDVKQSQDIGFSGVQAQSELIATFVSLVVLTPIFEELIFRGILFKGLRQKLGFWWAAIGASVIFAAAHGQWNVAVDTFALSLILCYLVEKSDSIVPSIMLHALKNGLAFALLFIFKVS